MNDFGLTVFDLKKPDLNLEGLSLMFYLLN